MCAPPRRLSQLTTSFFAYTRLGIHHVPFVACQKNLSIGKLQSHVTSPRILLDRIGSRAQTKHSNIQLSKSLARLGTPLGALQATFTGKPPSTRSPFLLSEKGRPSYVALSGKLAKHRVRKIVVEVRGLEPLTPYLQNRCSAN